MVRTYALKVVACSAMLSWLIACDASSVPRAQYDAKANEAEQLRKELDDIKNGPSRSLAESKADIATNDYQGAVAAGQRVLASYPQSPEAGEAKEIVKRAESLIAAAKASEEKARIQALSGMVKKHDDIRGLTFWRDKSMPAYVNTRSWVGAYIVTSDDGSDTSIHLVIYYKSDDWLFIDKYLFKADGDVITLSPEFGGSSVQRDNGEGGIWEWWDVPAMDDELAVLKKLSTAKIATVRYDGKQYYKDRIISPEECAAIKRTLIAYDAMHTRPEAK